MTMTSSMYRRHTQLTILISSVGQTLSFSAFLTFLVYLIETFLPELQLRLSMTVNEQEKEDSKRVL